MQTASNPTLYIRLRKKMQIRRGEVIRLGDVAQLLAEPEQEARIKDLVLCRPKPEEGNRVLLDMMLIVQKVKQAFPHLQIEHFGEPHVLVEVTETVKKPKLIIIVLVWTLLFVGSGLAIMNFHADVSMAHVHRRIYALLTGREVEYPLLLQIPYSFGIGLGMILFFNHLFQKKFNEEPSPLEVEMYMYQESVNDYVINEEYAKLHEKKESP
ncbi:stage V sporulation protein AA [Paenibacillus silviterrae]|uniref:stage V sporulation protein AA n=1 Tax=Paenibacillus silviterrae TaxID=3242194 RepID=UPI002543E49D|nr:stage V sporulation protein AA [Paenibacillus chinjuensis]